MGVETGRGGPAPGGGGASMSGKQGQRRGRAAEMRVAALLRRTKRRWVRFIRDSSLEEDAALKWDVVLETDRGAIGVQVKCSASAVRGFRLSRYAGRVASVAADPEVVTDAAVVADLWPQIEALYEARPPRPRLALEVEPAAAPAPDPELLGSDDGWCEGMEIADVVRACIDGEEAPPWGYLATNPQAWRATARAIYHEAQADFERSERRLKALPSHSRIPRSHGRALTATRKVHKQARAEARQRFVAAQEHLRRCRIATRAAHVAATKEAP